MLLSAPILIPLLAALLGGLCYALVPNGKAQELGRLVFSAGVLWLVYVLAHVRLH